MRHSRLRSRHSWAVIGGAFVAFGAGCSLVTSWDGLEGNRSAGLDATTPDASLADAADAGDTGPKLTCTVGTVSCGGHHLSGDADILYRCESDGGGSLVSQCMYGCLVSATAGDSCRICDVGGFYCGGDKIPGDPNTLYVCNANGTTTVSQICPNICEVRPGNDDRCM